MQRRNFLANTILASVAAGLGKMPSLESETKVQSKKIKKCLKIDMVGEKLSLKDKFILLKELGFDGVELNSPNELDPDEVLLAREKSGLEIPGVVNSLHWKYPLSDPDPAIRQKCLEGLEKSLWDCKLYGGSSVLFVPGVVHRTVSYKDAYERSQFEIKKILGTLDKTGVAIAFENVWNNFLLSPLEAARYVDEFKHPLVRWHFDVGNIINYGWPEHWINILNHRILKLDVKEYSRKKQVEEGIYKGFDVELMEGDCNWPEVMKALKKINYSGWASAEIRGGDRVRLAAISKKMDEIFGV